MIDSLGTRTISGSPQEANPPIDLIYELGDLTQVFTSLLVHELVVGGVLDLGVTINTMLPDAFRSTYFDDVTLQDCLSHTTGLPRLPNNIGSKQLDKDQPFEFYTSADLADFIRQWQPSNMDRKYQYSLIGFELVGIILEHRLAQPYGQIINEHLNPIYHFESLSTDVPHNQKRGKNRIGKEVDPIRFASFVASSGLKGSINDLVKLMSDSSNRSRKAFMNTLKIQVPTGIDPSTSIASGWHHYRVNRHHSFYLHKGSTAGHASFMAYHPVSNTGVVILSASKVNLGSMGYYIMGKLNDDWKKPKPK